MKLDILFKQLFLLLKRLDMIVSGSVSGVNCFFQLVYSRLIFRLVDSILQSLELLAIGPSGLTELFSLLSDGFLEGIVEASGGGRFLSLDLGSFQSLLQPPFEPKVLSSERPDGPLLLLTLDSEPRNHMRHLDWFG